MWKWASVGDGEGDCERRGKRDDAANAGERQQERAAATAGKDR